MTGPGSSPSTVPDLAALREKAEAVIEHPSAATVREWWDERENLSAESLLDVLSLVDGLRAENERLREALTIVLTEYRMFVRPQTDQVAGAVFRLAERALAGSPAANDTKEGGS